MTDRYRRWALAQCSRCNCGSGAAIAGAAAVAVIVWAVVATVIRYHVVIEQGVAVAGGTVVTAVAAWAALALRRRAACRVRAVTPCARACGRPATVGVTWANGVRSGEELLCGTCYRATEAADQLTLAAQDAQRERTAAQLAAREPGPAPEPSVAEVAREHGLVPAAPDNAPAASKDTALDLAAVLRTAGEYRRGHP